MKDWLHLSFLFIYLLILIGPHAEAKPTILPANLTPEEVRPGDSFRVTYVWEAEPMDKLYSVFVHFIKPDGSIVLQDDHNLPVPTETTSWTGKTSYSRRVVIPPNLPEGKYQIRAGLYNSPSNTQAKLEAGNGVKALNESAFIIGVVTVNKNAPPQKLDSDKPATLDLSKFKLTFEENFNKIEVSAWGPGTRWIAHTPFNLDFGAAQFTDPSSTFPFATQGGMLRIEAKKIEGKWRGGLLSSSDPHGNGFAQKFGYFEMRAKFPKGPGTWPAFWLMPTASLKNKSLEAIEIDVVEQYGHDPQSLHTTWHIWGPIGSGQKHQATGTSFSVSNMSEGFHNYGFYWDEKEMIWYFDGVELWRQPTPPLACTELYIMLNLALGGGWPIDKTPDPSHMLVEYVRVYSKLP